MNVEGNEEIIHSPFKCKINVVYCKEFRKGIRENCHKVERSWSNYLRKAMNLEADEFLSKGNLFGQFALLTLKRIREGEGVVWRENVFFREKAKLLLFLSFNIIISHIFPENFIEIPQLV